ncbi:MAG: hypothetical protein A2826_02680 [Candidatus Doudnabacteria bacterium RIFCSPHIGHO2_01_FULL_43_23]|uniref:NAD-dependent epimerase/dehydratase domain-containing protein n=1 Tax=Candidatus Doudnabacteria bacterium RIFCSPHIGHO2_01_FULL_43_23 TaxID=1817822 RepID=A0A1F5NRN6_9BACT|nr:MAG: hypothetical protein A2826_02680 [Candidatus Doudnabacteria bacterium RIFCSPHIGHO2_01_FULL_43_23]
MKVKGKIVLVTGGAGFIGSHLVDRVLEEGAAKIIILDNFVSGSRDNIKYILDDSKVEVVEGDVYDFNLVKKLVARVDIIFHEAASKLVVSRERPRVDLNTNIVGTFNILEACKGTEKRLIHASTGSVLGETSGEAMTEDHPRNPTTMYGISKGAAEFYCSFYHREFGVRVSILRYFHVFGPRQDYEGEAGVVSIFLGKVLRGESPIIFGSGEQIRCLTYVLDDVNANFMLLENDETVGQIYNVASHNRISVKDLAEKVIKTYGHGLRSEYGPARAGEVLRPIPDTGKIEKLGFKESISFEEGLEKTWQWIKKKEREKNRT